MDTPNKNGEIFLAESKGWKEEAEAVIYDVKDQVKDIKISEKLQVRALEHQVDPNTISSLFSNDSYL